MHQTSQKNPGGHKILILSKLRKLVDLREIVVVLTGKLEFTGKIVEINSAFGGYIVLEQEEGRHAIINIDKISSLIVRNYDKLEEGDEYVK